MAQGTASYRDPASGPHEDRSDQKAYALSVLVVDDDPMMRHFMQALLATDERVDTLPSASDATSAIEKARELQPDVAIVDIHMPGGGTSAIRGILDVSPGTKVLALSGDDAHATIIEAIAAGASGYLVKGASGSDIIETIFLTHLGRASAATAQSAGALAAVSEKLRREEEIERRTTELKSRIMELIDRDLIESVFQPIIELRRGAIVGVEALSRFPKSIGNVENCFKTAMAVGLAEELEISCIDAAFRGIDQLSDHLFISINASPPTITSTRFHDRILRLEHESMIEITEHTVVDDYQQLSGVLQALRDEGVGLAVDDAGAGYASLNHILNLAPDAIKLDRGLTSHIDTDEQRQALAAALIAFSEKVDTLVVAEGIETREELDCLLDLGVRLGQGFFLSRPVPSAQIAQTVRDH